MPTLSLHCSNCNTQIPYPARACVGCGNDIGFPNVRAAERKEEVTALTVRLKDAQDSAKARGCDAELEEFGTAVLCSQAVINRNLYALDAFINSTSAAMISYHAQVRAGGRLPENNEYDGNRVRVESTIHLHGVYEHISYAALSLDGNGISKFGPYSIALKDKMIQSRANVFEENSFVFFDKHIVKATDEAPFGYRAPWSRRSELAMAKLHSRIDVGMSLADFPGVLIEPSSANKESDFIEVHIYGQLHSVAIESVTGPMPHLREERIVWKKVKERLSEMGAEVREI